METYSELTMRKLEVPVLSFSHFYLVSGAMRVGSPSSTFESRNSPTLVTPMVMYYPTVVKAVLSIFPEALIAFLMVSGW